MKKFQFPQKPILEIILSPLSIGEGSGVRLFLFRPQRLYRPYPCRFQSRDESCNGSGYDDDESCLYADIQAYCRVEEHRRLE